VQHHAVVFEPQAARKFRISWHFLLIHFAIAQKPEILSVSLFVSLT
jgi:hypothetical protein